MSHAGGAGSNPGVAKTSNFEVLEVTAIYVTFLETSNLFLFNQGMSGAEGEEK